MKIKKSKMKIFTGTKNDGLKLSNLAEKKQGLMC
ncbi:unnamed protein product [Brugia timori]|uniref:Bm6966, isoform e n=2 Tax=Brugia TaxID=6278 RepID=A0A1I9FZM6_BRUMA|nr:Bm6966, isoform e [Brugia malayi]VDO40942.1 unnamed protein product [Brugia timori]